MLVGSETLCIHPPSATSGCGFIPSESLFAFLDSPQSISFLPTSVSLCDLCSGDGKFTQPSVIRLVTPNPSRSSRNRHSILLGGLHDPAAILTSSQDSPSAGLPATLAPVSLPVSPRAAPCLAAIRRKMTLSGRAIGSPPETQLSTGDENVRKRAGLVSFRRPDHPMHSCVKRFQKPLYSNSYIERPYRNAGNATHRLCSRLG